MRDPREGIAELLKTHTWWAAGNIGVPGMPDFITYKCNCGWQGDEPHHHVAEMVIAALTDDDRGWVLEQLPDDHNPDAIRCNCDRCFIP